MFGGPGVDAEQFAGGGFMRSTHEATQDISRPGLDVPKETLRSVFISQLAKAQATCQLHEDVVLDGRALKNVSILGKLLSKKVDDCLDVEIYDGTGTIEAKWYCDADESHAVVNSLQVGELVRVYGGFKVHEDPGVLATLNAYSIRPVDDANEVVYHQLDVMWSHLFLTKGQGGAGGMGGPAGAMPHMYAGGPSQMAAAGMGGFASQAAGALGGPGSDLHNVPMEIYTRVVEHIHANAARDVPLDELMQVVDPGVTRNQVVQLVQKAVSDAQCYQTDAEGTLVRSARATM